MDRMSLLVNAELLYAVLGAVASDESVKGFTLYRRTAFESTSDVMVQYRSPNEAKRTDSTGYI
jgi:hypothetical protein